MKALYLVNITRRIAVHYGYVSDIRTLAPGLAHADYDPTEVARAALDMFVVRSIGDDVEFACEDTLDDSRYDGVARVFGTVDWLDEPEARIISWETFIRDPDRFMTPANPANSA